MKAFTIGRNDAGQRLDRWLAKTLPLLPARPTGTPETGRFSPRQYRRLARTGRSPTAPARTSGEIRQSL